jgi:putative N6-adenine-specific DNA methylase
VISSFSAVHQPHIHKKETSVRSTYIAICAQDLVDIVAQELEGYGAVNIDKAYAAVRFEAELATAYRLHLRLQTPSRLLQMLRQGSGSSLAVVTNQARKVKWEEYFRPDSTYLIEGVVGDRGPEFPSATLLSKAVRLGLEDHFRKLERPLPKVDLKHPKIRVVAHLAGGELTLSLDTSGKSLHKRGYRGDNHPAPIKENLAAALLRLIGYDGSQTFYDPMCGSGTIAIEAAFLSLNKAPLIHRRKGDFGFEHLATFDSRLWRDVQESCRQDREEVPRAAIFASDIDGRFVTAARENALRARVERHIQFKQGSFFDLPAPASQGLLLSNFPYGERIGKRSENDMVEFYQKVGDTLKQKYAGWTAALLVAEESPYKFIGLRPKRRIPVDNGGIPCRLLIFELYAGKKHASTEDDATMGEES